MDAGFLVHKCRRCGKINKNVHVPNGLIYLCKILNDVNSLDRVSICNCKDGNLGVSDLIGFEKDESSNKLEW